MTESNSNNLENQPTQEPSFEERVSRQLELILTQLAAVQAEQATMRTEMIEHFVQLSRQIREVEARVARTEERFEDMDYKLDDFILKQIRVKREWRDLQAYKPA